MTLPDINRLMTHWSRFPPLRVLVAKFIGFEIPEPEAEKKYLTIEDIERFVRIAGKQIKMPGAV